MSSASPRSFCVLKRRTHVSVRQYGTHDFLSGETIRPRKKIPFNSLEATTTSAKKRSSYPCNTVPSAVESCEHSKSPCPPNFHFPACPPEPTLVLVPRDWCHCCFGRDDFVEAPARTTATVHQNSCANCYLAAVLNELNHNWGDGCKDILGSYT